MEKKVRPPGADNTHEVLSEPVLFPDEFKSWVTNWVGLTLGKIPASVIQGDPTQILTTAQFLAITSPTHGQRVIVSMGSIGVNAPSGAKTPAYWQFRYDKVAQKWGFLGGASVGGAGGNEIDSGHGGTSSTTNVTTGSSVVIPMAGTYEIAWGTNSCSYNSSAGSTTGVVALVNAGTDVDTITLAGSGLTGDTVSIRSHMAKTVVAVQNNGDTLDIMGRCESGSDNLTVKSAFLFVLPQSI